MYPATRNIFITKVLVPVMDGGKQQSAIQAAHSISGEGNVLLTGLIHVPEDQSLSTATVNPRKLRQTLKQPYKVKRSDKWAQVHVSPKPWEALVKLVKREDIDLLILEWPHHFEAMSISVHEALAQAPCNIAIVNQHIGSNIKKMLLPMRGGPYAELVLRIALSIRHSNNAQISSLHLFPTDMTIGQNAAFKGVDRVLRNLPEVTREDVITDDPETVIFDTAQKYDLLIMGASARPRDEISSLGPV